MELRQLRYFMAVAETLSFSEAARRLFISQSTLSQQIQQLEFELSAQLLVRSTHAVYLTEAGEMLVPIAEEVLSKADECKQRMADLRDGLGGELRIGVTYTGSSVLAEPIREFAMRYPRVHLRVFYLNTSELYDLLRHHRIDLALAYNMDTPDDILTQELYRDRLCLIAGKGWERKQNTSSKMISLEELTEYKMALPARQLQVRRLIDSLCQKSGIRLHEQVEIDDPNCLLDLVESSRLLTIQAGIVARIHSGLRAIPISDYPEALVGCVHTLRGTYQKRSATIFTDMVRQSLSLAALKM